jgi:FkbM family methyltransferase
VICAQTIHGPKIYLYGEDVSVTPEIAHRGTYELAEELFVKRIIRRGDWAIDVGANVGLFSLIIGQVVGPSGRVFAYEPNPLPASLLRRSLVMNWFQDRVVIREKGVGSEPARLQLRFSPGLLGGATFAKSENSGTFEGAAALVGGEESVDVEVCTLDAEFPVDLPIRFLKVDAEGFEHQVLRGAARLLERNCIDVLMLECAEDISGNNWDEYTAELKKIIDFGYQPHSLTKSSTLVPITFNDILYAIRERNIIFVCPDARHTIKELA